MLSASAVWCCRFWRQVPGHLRCVESNSLGLVWGIGWDGTAWVYSGRYGQQPTPGKPAPVDIYSFICFIPNLKKNSDTIHTFRLPSLILNL